MLRRQPTSKALQETLMQFYEMNQCSAHEQVSSSTDAYRQSGRKIPDKQFVKGHLVILNARIYCAVHRVNLPGELGLAESGCYLTESDTEA